MKTATIPSLRVAPELRQAAESLLDEGETLSAFVEQSIRSHIQQRRHQQEFIARGWRLATKHAVPVATTRRKMSATNWTTSSRRRKTHCPSPDELPRPLYRSSA